MAQQSRFLTYLSYFFLAVFLLSAAVQYNDPDPLLWIAIYGGAALLTWLFIRERLNWTVPAITGIALLFWAVFLLPQVWGVVGISDLFEAWEMQNIAIETAREAGGLLIIAVWFLVVAWRAYSERNAVPESDATPSPDLGKD